MASVIVVILIAGNYIYKIIIIKFSSDGKPALFSQTPGQIPLPNASAVMIMGILSIVGCLCYGVLGIVFGIIALVLYKQDKALYNANPGMYSAQSLSSLNTEEFAPDRTDSISIVLLVWYIHHHYVWYWCIGGSQHFMDHFQR
jgi:hypothetical protein